MLGHWHTKFGFLPLSLSPLSIFMPFLSYKPSISFFINFSLALVQILLASLTYLTHAHSIALVYIAVSCHATPQRFSFKIISVTQFSLFLFLFEVYILAAARRLRVCLKMLCFCTFITAIYKQTQKYTFQINTHTRI